MKVGVVGGGLMGLTLGYKLSKKDISVKIFEKGEQPGGLSTYHDYGDFVWDKFYHVILPTDSNLVQFLDEIDLHDKLNWRDSSTGYFINDRSYSISNTKEFLLFPPLTILDKLKLGFTIFYGSKINNWKKLEKITSKEWLTRLGGKRTFDKFWKPLLLAKFGENYHKASAVFIWTYIKRLFQARESSSAKKEQLGYVNGGYKTVFDRLQELLAKNESELVLNTVVKGVKLADDGRVEIRYDNEIEYFDKVIFTSPLNILEKVASSDLFRVASEDKGVEYMGVICMVLVTKKPLIPFYVMNLADEKIPFTGAIGMSTVVDIDQTSGHYLTYFPKYVGAKHPYWSMTDEELENIYMKGIQDLCPEYKKEDVISKHLNKAYKVQPLQVLNFSEIIPEINSVNPNFYILNTSQFVNDTLNNNTVVGHVNSFLARYESDFEIKETSENLV